MADEVKAKPRGPRVKGRAGAKDTPRPVISQRVRADVLSKLRASALEREFSISEEIERRLNASFDAETLEATLRRVVREEIEWHEARTARPKFWGNSTLEVLPGTPVTRDGEESAFHDATSALNEFEDGAAVVAALSEAQHDDAIAIMSEAQH